MMVINCKLCKIIICKYSIDLGDTVCIDVPDVPEGVGIKTFYICDNCAKKIAMELIER